MDKLLVISKKNILCHAVWVTKAKLWVISPVEYEKYQDFGHSKLRPSIGSEYPVLEDFIGRPYDTVDKRDICKDKEYSKYVSLGEIYGENT